VCQGEIGFIGDQVQLAEEGGSAQPLMGSTSSPDSPPSPLQIASRRPEIVAAAGVHVEESIGIILELRLLLWQRAAKQAPHSVRSVLDRRLYPRQLRSPGLERRLLTFHLAAGRA
jgi:hypothetical protein